MRKDKRRQSTQNLLGIQKITDYSIVTGSGELVFYIIKPTNLSVLPAGAVSAKIRALQNTLSTQSGVELLALNSRESFSRTCLFYQERMQEETNPALRQLLEQDNVHSGMANAKAKGAKIGRPQTTVEDIPAVFLRHYPAFQKKQLNVSELARVCDLSRTTVYKYIGMLEH